MSKSDVIFIVELHVNNPVKTARMSAQFRSKIQGIINYQLIWQGLWNLDVHLY